MQQLTENKSRKRYVEMTLIAILVIFYTVGVTGLLLPAHRDAFLGLSSMNLLLSFFVLLLARKTKKPLFTLFLFLCFLTGMAVEWIGIHTGWLFGDYAYGANLGAKFDGVPLIIGINWGILSVVTCTAAAYFNWKPIFKALFSALLMMGLDILIEPVAIDSDYWQWHSTNIPVFNYVCWYLIALPLHFVYFRWKLDEQNKVSIALFVIMVLFFVVLNFR